MMILFFIIIFIAIVVMIAQVSAHARSHEDTQRELAAKMADETLLSETDRMTRLAEVLIQSKIVGDEKTYQAVLNETYNGQLPEPRDNGGYLSIYDNLRILKIAGINYRTGINRYLGRVMCALVPEPDNEYDPDAIKIVAEDRHHLGYIPSEHTDFVRSMAGGEFPYRCEAHIYESEDEEDGHKFFYGFVYIKKK